MTGSRFPEPPPALPPPASLSRPLTRRDVVQGLGGAAIVFVAMYLLGAFTPAGRKAIVAYMSSKTLLALPVAWYGTVFVHELGHLLAGVAVGMRPFAFCVGPLRIDFAATGWTVQRNRLIAQSGGLALCFPTERSHGRWPFIALVAGGPLASGALALAASAVAGRSSGFVAAVAVATAAIAGILTLLNLVPMRAGGYTTDGGQIAGLLRDDPAVRARLALLALVAQSHGGTRPRELDATAVAALHGTGVPDLDACALAFVAGMAVDRADLEAARGAYTALARALRDGDPARLPPPTRRALALSIAGWLGHYERDAAGARAWLEYGRGALFHPHSLGFAEAGVAFAEGRGDDARRHIAAVRAALPALPDRGGAIALGDELDRLETRLAARATAAA